MAKTHLPLRQSVSSLTFPQGLGVFHSADVLKRSSKSSIFLSKVDSCSAESALTDHLSAVLSGVFLGELCSDSCRTSSDLEVGELSRGGCCLVHSVLEELAVNSVLGLCCCHQIHLVIRDGSEEQFQGISECSSSHSRDS